MLLALVSGDSLLGVLFGGVSSEYVRHSERLEPDGGIG